MSTQEKLPGLIRGYHALCAKLLTECNGLYLTGAEIEAVETLQIGVFSDEWDDEDEHPSRYRRKLERGFCEKRVRQIASNHGIDLSEYDLSADLPIAPPDSPPLALNGATLFPNR